jgi:hypothetical protein
LIGLRHLPDLLFESHPGQQSTRLAVLRFENGYSGRRQKSSPG